MEYRKLGQTDMEISALSYGASSLGGVFRKVDPEHAMTTVPAALDRGINFIDVSPFYGLTQAETVLGEALKQIKRDRYYLATKVGRYGMDEFDFSAERVKSSVDESLQRLHVDHLDIIQCHDIEFVNLDQIVEETLPALHEVVAEGKARYVGITGLPLKVFTEVLSRVDADMVDTILSYCHYELNDTALQDILDEMERLGVGVINASPTGMGLLTERGVPDWHPAPPEVIETCARAVEHCKSKGVDIVQLAVQFAVRQPRIASTLVGTASPENIIKNIEWAEQPIDQELLNDVLRILKPIHNVTWASGLPENN